MSTWCTAWLISAPPPSTFQDSNDQNKTDTDKTDAAATAEQTPAETPKAPEKPVATQQNAKALNPQANTELDKNEVTVISKAGLRNKSLQEITNMIFQKFPVRVGDVYKHQFDAYAQNLLVANSNAFKKSGNDYICIADIIMHIPAYNSPRATVAFPK